MPTFGIALVKYNGLIQIFSCINLLIVFYFLLELIWRARIGHRKVLQEDNRRRVERTSIDLGVPRSTIGKYRFREKGNKTYFRPRFAFWTSCNSVRTVFPENFPDRKLTGLPIGFCWPIGAGPEVWRESRPACIGFSDTTCWQLQELKRQRLEQSYEV